ncbi:hypothetical protein C8R44DRAFT_733028 [Mycena epipterygia]|nr:hypothetical protein C8R44DRAFT_733028 [Mycena epipterygia]
MTGTAPMMLLLVWISNGRVTAGATGAAAGVEWSSAVYGGGNSAAGGEARTVHPRYRRYDDTAGGAVVEWLWSGPDAASNRVLVSEYAAGSIDLKDTDTDFDARCHWHDVFSGAKLPHFPVGGNLFHTLGKVEKHGLRDDILTDATGGIACKQLHDRNAVVFAS